MNPLEFKFSARESINDERTIVHDMATPQVYTKGGFTYSPNEIENQHKVGICTAISLIQNAEKALGKKYSPDFQYLLQKKFIDLDWTEGSSIFSALKVGKNYGFLPLEFFTYITEADRILPYEQYIAKLQAIPDSEIQRLLTLCEKKLTGYAKLNLNTDSIAKAVNDSMSGILCRYTVTNNWWTPSWNPIDINPLKNQGEIVGGHAINLTAYDYTNGKIATLTNTWGILWNRGGNAEEDLNTYQPTEAWIPYYGKEEVQKFTQTLQVGSQGNEVKLLQDTLRNEGVFNQISTGYFGTMTKTAVIAFQKKYGILQTGIVGPLTRNKLNNLNNTTMNVSMTQAGNYTSLIAFTVLILNNNGINLTTDNVTTICNAGVILIGLLTSIYGRYRQGNVNLLGIKTS